MNAIIRRRLVLIAAAIAASLAIGTAGYMIIDGYPAFDAFYMAVITITTVGYSEIHPLSQAGRLFNSLLLLVGVSTLFLAVGVVTQTVFELEFNHYFARRRTRRMIEKLNNHYIICGFGRIGRGAAHELRKLRRDIGVIVLGIRKASGQMIFNPDADSVISAGDFLIAMGGAEQLRNLEKAVGES